MLESNNKAQGNMLLKGFNWSIQRKHCSLDKKYSTCYTRLGLVHQDIVPCKGVLGDEFSRMCGEPHNVVNQDSF